MRILALLLPASLIVGCAADLQATSAFQQMMHREFKKLPYVIDYAQFATAAKKSLLLDYQQFLDEHNIPVHGSGDGRYLNGPDLLAACGEQCSPDAGFGQVLARLLINR
ncbi:MAG: hypothetical protein OXC81_06910 [Betaproteobacteria bacterium]|nr:hypothetical protein [Betaproteobacteria bacterium]